MLLVTRQAAIGLGPCTPSEGDYGICAEDSLSHSSLRLDSPPECDAFGPHALPSWLDSLSSRLLEILITFQQIYYSTNNYFT